MGDLNNFQIEGTTDKGVVVSFRAAVEVPWSELADEDLIRKAYQNKFSQEGDDE
jgi:hypothetical protein